MPGIKNPGPQLPSKISVLYHNVQGFLITRELHKENPLLDTKKVSDFQSYVYLHKPDIIILNETWLNKSILDNEIFTNSNYKVFRRDRSALSHPPDILNPKKYKNVAGGVAIAVRSDLDLKPTVVKSTSKAEILSVFLKTNSGKKYVSQLYIALEPWRQTIFMRLNNTFDLSVCLIKYISTSLLVILIYTK